MKVDQLLQKIESNRLVYVSETHTRFDHHLNQLAIIRHQYEQHEKLAIGVEFIQRPFQSVLDDFVAGRIDEEAMLKGARYFDRWSYDYRLYRPVFQFAQEHGIPIIALNIDSEILDHIKKDGNESLNAEQRARLPSHIKRDDEAYRQRILDTFKHHPGSDDKDFEGFLEIQLLWDESMAETAADWLKANPDGYMVVLAGSGHIMFGNGIPDRVQRRIDVSAVSVINLDQQSSISADMGDFIILSEERELAPSGRLGIILDNKASPPVIIGFGENSEADDAGLEEDDKIIRIGERVISDYSDVRMALLDREVGEVVEVEVRRSGFFSGSKTYTVSVRLK